MASTLAPETSPASRVHLLSTPMCSLVISDYDFFPVSTTATFLLPPREHVAGCSLLVGSVLVLVSIVEIVEILCI
jgi:hypothetical protein